jgi:hypothetical protein
MQEADRENKIRQAKLQERWVRDDISVVSFSVYFRRDAETNSKHIKLDLVHWSFDESSWLLQLLLTMETLINISFRLKAVGKNHIH